MQDHLTPAIVTAQTTLEHAKLKIERGQKGGYGYELTIDADTVDEVLSQTWDAKQRIEKVLYGGEHNAGGSVLHSA